MEEKNKKVNEADKTTDKAVGNAEDEAKKYEFVKQTIKKRPINKLRVLRKVLLSALLGLVFGIAACLTFIFMFPHIQSKITPETVTPVTIPVEEELEETVEQEYLPTESVATEPDKSKQAAGSDNSEDLTDETVEPEETSAIDDETADDEKTKELDSADSDDDDQQDDEGELTEEVTDKETEELTETEESLKTQGDIDYEQGNEEVSAQEGSDDMNAETMLRDLELDDYKKLFAKISSVATDAQRSMVMVSDVRSDTDWFNNEYENNNIQTGVIAAKNEKEIFVVAMANMMNESKTVDVTFCDGNKSAGRILHIDPNTGLAIISVFVAAVDAETMDAIKVAGFSGIAAATRGTPVLAVGSLFGEADSMAVGLVTSNSIVVDMVDTNTKVISTDIYGSANADGVLVNLSGRVLGFICHENISSDMPNLIRAYSISDIRSKIERISNGKGIAFLGILGTDVTDEAHEELDVPYGAYVKEVDVNSPAIVAGIRSGDIIVKMNETDIGSFSDYKDFMINASPGDIARITIRRSGRINYMEITYEVVLEAM